MWTIEKINELVLDVPDFPIPGIVFKDITPILENHEAFVSVARQFVRQLPQDISKIVAMESRGFIFGAAVCQHLDVGLVLVRKPGKLPRETKSYTYDLEYGTDTLEIHSDALKPGERVVIMDDVLATGGTAMATQKLVEEMGAQVVGFEFLMEIEALKGRNRLSGAPVNSLIKC
ncbi:MAG: adenine phosphoribosyltransferase [Bdellovibrionales bacterium]